MSGDDNANLVYTVLLLTMVAGSLFSRRLPIGQTLKMLSAWAGIFAALFLVFSYRGELAQVWQRVKGEFTSDGVVANDGTLRVRQGPDGHFQVNAEVNGRSMRFLIDSGATTTTLNRSTAESAGVEIDDSDFPVIVQTANGMAESRRARAARFIVGPISREDFPIHVADGLGETNLIGMNWLSTLKSWRVEGDELVLNP
jgi:aspartyl protease family protein